MLAILIAITTCGAALCLTAVQPGRTPGALLALVTSLLWLVAGLAAGKAAVILVAGFCAVCFARPLLRGRPVRLFGSRNAN